MWACIALAGQLVVLAGFWLGRRVLANLTGRMTALWTLGVVLGVVLARGYVIDLLAVAAGVGSGLELAYRTVSSIPLIGGALLVSGQIACARAEHRAAMHALRTQQDELSKAQSDLDDQLARVDDRFRRSVQETLAPRVTELEAALDAAAAGQAEIPFAEIRDLVDNDIHVLINELARENWQPEPSRVVPEPRSAPRVRLSMRLPLASALRPELQGIAVGVAAFSSVSRNLTPVNAVAACMVFGLITVCLLEILRLLVRRGWLPTTLVIVLAGCAGGAATYGAIRTTELLFTGFPSILHSAALVFGAIVALAIALYGAVGDHRRAVECEMSATVLGLEASTSQLRRRAWIARRRLSLLLHGSIQGALHASALRLGSLGSPTATDIAEVKREVSRAFALLDDPPHSDLDLEVVLESIVRTWHGSCDISWSISPEAAKCVRINQEIRECVGEIVREASHNAIIHGKATRVSVDVCLEADLVEITVQDNGEMAHERPGTGTSMLNEMCKSWNRTRNSIGTVLHAELEP